MVATGKARTNSRLVLPRHRKDIQRYAPVLFKITVLGIAAFFPYVARYGSDNISTVWLYNVVPKGFFPQQDTGMVFGITEAAQDISFNAMVEKQNLVTEIVKRDPAVASVTSAVGSGGGGSGSTGRMFISLKP